MIKRFKEFKELNEAEVDPEGNLIDFKIRGSGTLEDPMEISSDEYFDLTHPGSPEFIGDPEFIGQSRADKKGNYKMVWKIGETYYLTRGNIYN
jgi:hypothetical protein